MTTTTAQSPETRKTNAEEIKARLRGPVILPSDAAYEDARKVWNGTIDRRPAIIARSLGIADVMACVKFAREAGMTISVKAGGHNIAGLAVCDNGLMVDLSLMRAVWVDPGARTAHAQAGCLLGDVDRETQVHGLATVLGFVSMTGIAGLTVGGGFGYLSRRFGWTSDSVLSMEVVTAEGRIVHASPDQNPDLFWALCGGGGNFGIVVDFEYKLYPVGPEIVGGAIAWPAEDAEAVLELHRRLTAEAPPEFACVAGLRIAPPAPWLAKSIHGKPIVLLVVCDTGNLADAEKRAGPIKAFGHPVGDIIQRRPYVTQQSLLDATQPNGRRYYWKSEYLSRATPECYESFLEHSRSIISPHSAILLFPLGGGIAQHPDDYSAVGNRDTAWVLNITSAWDKPDDDAANIGWARKTWEEMRRFSSGGTYINFQTEDEGNDRVRAAYGKNYDRLVEVKTKWDPQNLFRANKNIAPRGVKH